MRVLLVKTSSMGDIIHTFPALTDAQIAFPALQIDWVVEDVFAEIPQWHPAVSEIIPVSLRRWRKGIFKHHTRVEWRELCTRLQVHRYDLVLDAQGLVKSAFLSLFTRGTRAGLNFKSARETLAACAYQKRYAVNFYQHAVVRMRSLFSQALGYPLSNAPPNFNLSQQFAAHHDQDQPYLVFLHGTTWRSKLWPESYWQQLAHLVTHAGLRVKISGGSEEEVARARRIAANNSLVEVFPHLSIPAMAKLLAKASGAVAVDTGFGHLAAALDVPTVSLYGSTNPQFTGALGKNSVHLAAEFACAPCLKRECTYKKTSAVEPACYEALSPARVWQTITRLIRL